MILIVKRYVQKITRREHLAQADFNNLRKMDEIKCVGDWSLVKRERQGGMTGQEKKTDIYIIGFGKRLRSNKGNKIDFNY